MDSNNLSLICSDQLFNKHYLKDLKCSCKLIKIIATVFYFWHKLAKMLFNN